MATMSIGPRDERESDEEQGEQREIEIVRTDDRRQSAVCVNELLALIRRRTNEFLPNYTIIEFRSALPHRGASLAEGLFFGTSLCVGRLEVMLGDLRVAVMEGDMTAERAIERAREEVLAAVKELRFGAHLRRRFFATATLPASAELGRLVAIVEHFADDLDQLGERCFGVRPHSTSATTVRLHLHAMEE